MKLIEARETLSNLKVPVLTLQDVIGVFQVKKAHASQLMRRLEAARCVIKLKRGMWAWPHIELLCIPSYLTAPLPCYISLQSALFYHGVIDQIPGYIQAVTLGRKQKTITPFGTFSIHQIDTHYFYDYETHTEPFFQIATAEKALIDTFYLSRVAPSLFGKLPELDLTQLNYKKMISIISKIENKKTKTFLEEKVKKL